MRGLRIEQLQWWRMIFGFEGARLQPCRGGFLYQGFSPRGIRAGIFPGDLFVREARSRSLGRKDDLGMTISQKWAGRRS